MTQLTDKQRQVIRLAYQSKNAELRKEVLKRFAKLKTAEEHGEHNAGNYNPQFISDMKSLGEYFPNPNYVPGNPRSKQKVRWNSLDSQTQSEYHRRYDSGEMDDDLRRIHGDEWRRSEGGGQGGGGGGQAAPQRGQKYRDRKELRSVPKKDMMDGAGLSRPLVDSWFDTDKLKRNLGENKAERLLNGIANWETYNDLDALEGSLEFVVDNPDHEYSKNQSWLRAKAKLDEGDLKRLYKGVKNKMKDVRGFKYNKTVLRIANENDLESEDADAIRQFRLDKPPTGRKLSPEELKKKFLEGDWADAETKKRVREMSAEDFMAMRNSILMEEDEDELAPMQAAASLKQASTKDDVEFARKVLSLPEGLQKQVDEKRKKASAGRLSSLGRKLVRIAHSSKDPEVRARLVRLVKDELSS